MSNESTFLLLNESIQQKLSVQNINKPTAVQNQIIPQILEGKDILFQSETGTGKTFAYLLPLIHKIEADSDVQNVKVIVIAPTIELASQINLACKTVSSRKSALLVGGAPLKRQIEILKEKPQIVIGTAARLNELIRLKKLKVDKVIAIIFDETDRLVKKELYDETNEIKSLMPKNCQIIACSATLNNATKKFFYGIDSVTLEPENILKDKISHWAIFAEARDKIDTLRKFLLAENPTKALIFTSRADQVENIYNKLTYKKIDCECLHAKADKQKRKSAIDRFKSGKAKILVTSDLAARGLDIQEVTHIIQMDLPSDEDFFVHRCGRTARAGKKGINVVIGDEYEMNHYAQLEKKLGLCVYPKEIYNGKVSEIRDFDE